MVILYGNSSAVNKRLDEWVTEDRMDVAKLETVKKENKVTPVKLANGVGRPCSRPSSPDLVCTRIKL